MRACVCICLSVCLSISVSVYVQAVYMSVCLSVCLSISVSVYVQAVNTETRKAGVPATSHRTSTTAERRATDAASRVNTSTPTQ